MRAKTLQNLLSFLQKNGFQTACFSDFKSCFDIAARREDLNLLVKVLENIDSLRPESAKEMQKLANVLNAVSLIVGEKSKAFKLKKGVIFERHSIPTVSFETFKDLFSGEIPEINYFKGRETVALDSEKLKSLRSGLNLSAQGLAERIGSSAESIYRFEQGSNASLELAKRLEEELGERLILQSNPLHSMRQRPEGVEKVEDSALKQLNSLGLKIAVFNHAPFKAFSKNLPENEEPLIINKGASKVEIERKALVLERTKAVFDSHSMIIAKEFKLECIQHTPVVLEKELEELHKKKELLKLLKEREN
ncbi:MAG: helix-turn-helix domain-containing protein [Candidatus Diapherotrites archaeon]|nr:helix-turn-helix domain-containing protein [Candidatus Diapherotrites archaeon]